MLIRRSEFLSFLTGSFSSDPLSAQCDSLFQDLGKLKSRPAHLGVFLRYIFSQADPSPLVRDPLVSPSGARRGGSPGGVFGTIPSSS